MTSNRLVVEVVTQLIQRIETLESEQTTVNNNLEDVDKQVKRLAKELYKTNLLNDSTPAHDDSAIQKTDIANLLQQIHDDLSREQQKAIQQARLDVVRAFIPVIDSIEAGLRSGVSQLKRLQDTDPETAQTLYGWLNGQRLLRERLLKLLEAEGVEIIDAVNCPFDPYQHVASKIVSIPGKPKNAVVKVERAGYKHADTVLRYADVVVNKLD